MIHAQNIYKSRGTTRILETLGAWVLAILWGLPLLYALWTAIHPASFSTQIVLSAPLTFENFQKAFQAAPFVRYFVNTIMLVTIILVFQLIICTLAAFAFARFSFRGSTIAFSIVFLQIMVMPDILIIENYKTIKALGVLDTLWAIALPYLGSGFGVFLLRQAFKMVPKELDDAAAIEGATTLQILWHVYVPLAKPTYIAYSLVSISYHWNNFLWPLVVTSSVSSRTLTVGLQIFSSVEQGVNWAIISAATLITSIPLLIVVLLFQRQFIQSFMHSGIK